MIYPADYESKIGFDSIRNLLVSLCASRLGKEEAQNMRFSASYNAIIHNLTCITELLEIRRTDLPFPVPTSLDIFPSLSEIKTQNSFISAEKLLRLSAGLIYFSEVNNFFNSNVDDTSGLCLFPELKKEVLSLSLFPDLINIISNSINKFGEVKDTASPLLFDIRQQIKRMQGSMQRSLHRIFESAVLEGIVDKDSSPSVRDGRLVIPVSASNKRLLNGIVHDESSSGKTVYIEPVEVVEAGNRLRELELEEKREITKILISIADVIRPFIDDIEISCRIIGNLDFIYAKSSLALDLGAQMPRINIDPEIEWYHAEHPGLILSLRQTERKVVPLNIQLSQNKRILIISGPNAGGKSVCLKTVACVQYMMQCGLLPTLYGNSHMGIFKNIFIDIGDEQSFENDLSTYSSHLRNMKFFLQNANNSTLLLADEMGSGTEPEIGGALAQAILSQLGKSGCYGVVTTHYQNLKTFADSEPGFVNGAMLYDRAHLAPTFQLSIGNAGSSFAIDIAHKMGIPKSVIDEAKTIVGEDYINLDKYLSDISRDKKYWANKRLNIKEKEHKLDKLLTKYEDIAGDLTAQRKSILNDARKEAKEILDSANARIERTILEIRKSQAEKEKTKVLRKALKEFSDETLNADSDKEVPKEIIKLKHKSKNKSNKNIEKRLPKQTEDPKIQTGDFVFLDSGTMAGEVLSINGNKAEIAFGALRTIAEISRLKLTKKPAPKILDTNYSISATTSEESRKRQLNFKNEIDVRGMRADEAIQAVTYFLDDAIQFNASRIRILHGTGHGILKTLIRQFLKSNTAIKSYYDEDIRFGGAGITVVDLE